MQGILNAVHHDLFWHREIMTMCNPYGFINMYSVGIWDRYRCRILIRPILSQQNNPAATGLERLVHNVA